MSMLTPQARKAHWDEFLIWTINLLQLTQLLHIFFSQYMCTDLTESKGLQRICQWNVIVWSMNIHWSKPTFYNGLYNFLKFMSYCKFIFHKKFYSHISIMRNVANSLKWGWILITFREMLYALIPFLFPRNQ